MKLLVGIPTVLLSTAVLFAYLTFIWWLDRYEREPFWLVGLVFLWGATIGAGCSCGLNMAIMAPARDVLSAGASTGVAAIAVAPIIEELMKGLVFVPLVTTDHFDNETDGLIYGAATGLGFATVENLMYFTGFMASSEFGTGGMVVAMTVRTFFSATVHTIASALLGMAVGYARHRHARFNKWIVYPLIGYVLAVLSHATWNTASVLSSLHLGFQLVGIVLVVLAAGMLFAITQWSLRREHQAIRTQLTREAERGTLPAEHVDIIPYWSRRRKSDWVPAGVDREAYVEAATLLAFRRHQLELAGGKRRGGYVDDIETYRQKVLELLGRAGT